MHQSERAFRAHATGPQVKRWEGLTGSCCRGAGYDEGKKYGSKGLPGQNFSKGLLSLFTRHGVHRAYPAATSCYTCTKPDSTVSHKQHQRAHPMPRLHTQTQKQENPADSESVNAAQARAAPSHKRGPTRTAAASADLALPVADALASACCGCGTPGYPGRCPPSRYSPPWSKTRW